MCPAPVNRSRSAGDSSCQAAASSGSSNFTTPRTSSSPYRGSIGGRSARGRVPVQVARVFLLNVQAVAEHDRSQVGRRGRAVDGTAESGPKKPRQIAAMVDVGMGEDHRVKLRRSAAELPVLGVGFRPMSLEESAIQQDPQRVGFEQMLAAGDFPCGP